MPKIWGELCVPCFGQWCCWHWSHGRNLSWRVPPNSTHRPVRSSISSRFLAFTTLVKYSEMMWWLQIYQATWGRQCSHCQRLRFSKKKHQKHTFNSWKRSYINPYWSWELRFSFATLEDYTATVRHFMRSGVAGVIVAICVLSVLWYDGTDQLDLGILGLSYICR